MHETAEVSGFPTAGRLLLATRNPHKVREIGELLTDLPVELVSLEDLAVPPLPKEDDVEIFNSFEENALAKARFYRIHTGMTVVADDSGLCVDALNGGPGVRSRRFAPNGEESSGGQDQANNDYLLDQMADLPDEQRGAHYRCALALVGGERTILVSGRVDGRITREPAGGGGFGYDPLFLVPAHGRTFGELPPEVKASMSHRAEAIRSFRRWLYPIHKQED